MQVVDALRPCSADGTNLDKRRYLYVGVRPEFRVLPRIVLRRMRWRADAAAESALPGSPTHISPIIMVVLSCRIV